MYSSGTKVSPRQLSPLLPGVVAMRGNCDVRSGRKEDNLWELVFDRVSYLKPRLPQADEYFWLLSPDLCARRLKRC